MSELSACFNYSLKMCNTSETYFGTRGQKDGLVNLV